MNAVHKKTLIRKSAKLHGIYHEDAAKLINTFLEEIMDATAEHGKLTLRGFAKFEIIEATQSGFDFKEGETTPARKMKRVKITPSKDFKQRVKNG